jgi:hypothetical protein
VLWLPAMLPLVLCAPTAAATAGSAAPVETAEAAPPADAKPSGPSTDADSSPLPPSRLPPTNASPDLEAPARLRSGVVVGLTLGGGIGSASGYPNAASDINNPTFFSASGFMGGTSGTFFVMGALSDYLSFGFWLGTTMYRNADWRSNGGGGGLRVEAFPLVHLVPALSGLGLMANFGIGGASLQSSNPARPESNGTQSYLGAGAFYEWAFGHMFGGHFAVGPNLEYDAMWSQPFERHGLIASVRIVFYGGP